MATFSLPGKFIKIKIFISAQNNWAVWKYADTREKIWAIKGIFMLCDNFKHGINVEESFHLSPNFLGSLEISWYLKIFRQFERILYAAQKIQANYEVFKG
jgi:hypothetical protein